MPEYRRTTTIEVGRLEATAGQVAVSYSPERGWFQLYVNDPSDRRRAGSLLALTREDFKAFKALLLEVERVADASSEASPPRQGSATGPGVGLDSVARPDGPRHVVVQLSTGPVRLESLVFQWLQEKVAGGSALLAASTLSKQTPGLGMAAARELVDRIVEEQRARGDRE